MSAELERELRERLQRAELPNAPNGLRASIEAVFQTPEDHRVRRDRRSTIRLLAVAALIAAGGLAILIAGGGPNRNVAIIPSPDVGPSASASTEPRSTPIVTPALTPEPSPTAVPPEVTGWVTRELDVGNECCSVDDLAASSAAGGTIHAVDHEEEAYAGGWDAGRYQRSRDEGRTWEAEHQLPGVDVVVAAADDRVFIAFQPYVCRSGIGFVRNTKNGAPSAWSGVACLRGDASEISPQWAPRIAATGSSVYVLSIDSQTAKVHLRTSHDAGRTFASKELGEARPNDDWTDPVMIAADDEVVVAGWSDAGQPVVRVSRDAGRTWGLAVSMPLGMDDVEARDGRILVQGSFGADARPWYQLASGDHFEPVAAPDPTIAPNAARAKRLVLGPAGTLGALGPDPTCATTWRTSSDSGATWSLPERIADGCLGIATGDTSPLPISWLDEGHILAVLDGTGDTLIAERP